MCMLEGSAAKRLPLTVAHLQTAVGRIQNTSAFSVHRDSKSGKVGPAYCTVIWGPTATTPFSVSVTMHGN